jgi:hypothetical protein
VIINFEDRIKQMDSDESTNNKLNSIYLHEDIYH